MTESSGRPRNRSAETLPEGRLMKGGEFANLRSHRLRVLCVIALTPVLGACASTEITNLDGFESIPMSRVVPFPSEAERSHRAFEVAIVEGRSGGIDEALLEEPRLRVGQELRKMAVSAGARVLSRSEVLVWESEGLVAPDPATDYDLVVNFSVYRDVATWKPPFKFLWQSPDEVSRQPGTCAHQAELEFDVEVVEPSRDGHRVETYSLRHSAGLKIDELDQSCPLDAEPRLALFDTALLESLSCLKPPLDRLLAPRGYVMAHRRARDSGSDLYEISIGTSQGIEPGDAVEVRREQHASTPTGEAWRTERVIARGVVIDQAQPEMAWVAIDVDRATDEILAGDVIRPIVSQSLLSSLSGPNCKAILEIR